MNILYLLFSFTTGGTERLVADICNEMTRREHNVHLYVVNDLYNESMLNALSPQVQVYLQKRPVGGGGKLQTLLSVVNYMRRNRIDVVHCNSLDAPELLLLKPLLCPRAKILYTVHGMHQMKTKSRLHIALRNLMCHKVIAISDCVKQDIIAAGIRADKVATVTNAIDLSKFPAPAQRDFDPAVPVIGNVARIHPETKGQDILLRAIARLKKDYPGIRCLFAGGPAKGQEHLLQSLIQLAQDLDISKNVRFVGSIDDVPGFLSQIDIFALPSRSEGFGISLVEAMTMGIPCVASNLEGPAEVLQDGEKGTLFTPEEEKDLAEKLHHIIENYSAHKATALANVDYVSSEYAIETMCNHLESLAL